MSKVEETLRVCFVTDGGRTLGLGHVQQSMALARTFQPGADVFFLTKSDETVLGKIRENGFRATVHPDDSTILRRLSDLSPAIVIFDKLDVAVDLARAIKRTLDVRLVIFTNLTAANRHADVSVTADIGSRFENIRFVDEETGTTYFYGPRYWVLRPEFYEFQRRCKVAPDRPDRILLIFGGSDPANLTSEALDQLLLLPRTFQIDVVLGAHFCSDGDLRRVLCRHAEKAAHVIIHRNTPSVAELMYRADLVVASPGLSAFEALRVGTPVIVVPHDPLQRDTYQGFMRMLERDELWKLGEVIERGESTRPLDAGIARMQIGEGVDELREAILCMPGGVEK